jgi:DNA-binding NtrC family response regulator
MAASILIVDDDAVARRLVEHMVQKCGYETLVVESGDAAIAMLTASDAPTIDAVVLDLVMPGLDGMGVLAKIGEAGLNIPVIVQTAHGGIDNVVSAMRAGAQDFVVKPVGIERLQVSLRNALNASALKGELQRIKHSREGRLTFADIITRSETMAGVLRTAQKAASSTIPVLVEGESGVGKELFARAIHGSGERKSKPFVAVNCGAIPDNLAESILFGHEKGAFTGATERHTGKFVEASGGTLFLDEVSELPLPAQVKLLRALQEGAVEAVGGRKPVKVDVRIISATNRKLLERVKSGHFREDLFYRLHVLPLTIPPLRMRREDIPHLLRHFLARFCAEENRPITGISGEAMAHLSQLEWPRNIRQLENAVYRAVVMSDSDQLGLADFPQAAAQSPPVSKANSPDSEALILGPGFHSTSPAMVSGNEIPIVPPAIDRHPGDADDIRRNAAAGGNGERDHPVRDLTLSRADVRSRTPTENRPLDTLPQAR